jgi:glycosyltransferase involved in cell wall biosynthesis
LPLVAARFGTREYARRLETMLQARDFDAVILDQYAMAWAIGHVQRSRANGARPLIAHIAHDYETEVTADIARNFRGNLLRKAGLQLNAWKTANAEYSLARAADLIVTLTAEDAESFSRISPLSVNVVLPPGYDGSRAPERLIARTTPRRVAIVGSYRWTPKQMNLSAFLEAADPIFQNAGIGLDVVGEAPDSFRNAWETRLRATRFHGFVDNLGEFLAARRMGLVVEETGGGFKLKTLDYIFYRVPIAAIKGSMTGLPLTSGSHHLCFGSMRDLAQGVAAVIDDVDRLNALQQAAYEKCKTSFDWSDRGRALRNALQQAAERRCAPKARKPAR